MKKLNLTQLEKHVEDFAELCRRGGWKVDLTRAAKITPPVEDILLFTVRFGKQRKP